MFHYIPIQPEDTGFMLLLFPPIAHKKIRNRVDYYSSFYVRWAKKSSRIKTSIFRLYGYSQIISQFRMGGSIRSLAKEKLADRKKLRQIKHIAEK